MATAFRYRTYQYTKVQQDRMHMLPNIYIYKTSTFTRRLRYKTSIVPYTRYSEEFQPPSLQTACAIDVADLLHDPLWADCLGKIEWTTENQNEPYLFGVTSHNVSAS